jgi:predicted DNA-binding transcriptional regulator YafY
MAKRGRPPGAYGTHRRLEALRGLLESHPKGMTLETIASSLRVTDRSIRRYLKELERDVDVERVPVSNGSLVVRIPSRDLPRRVKLHRTQIYGLLMARRVFRMLDGTVFEKSLRDAVETLLSHVQRAPRRGAEVDPDTRLEERFLYLPATPMRPLRDSASPSLAEAIDEVLDACAQLRVCRVRYRKAGPEGLVEAMTIHPYAVVLYKDAIYVVAFVRERDAIRTLRADRIVEANALPLDHFTVPDDFDVDAHFAGQFGVHGGDKPTRVVVDFDARVAELVRARSFPGVDGGEAPIEALPGGGVRLTMHIGPSPELRSWILSFGETARVREPTSLVEQVRREIEGAVALYRSDSSPRNDPFKDENKDEIKAEKSTKKSPPTRTPKASKVAASRAKATQKKPAKRAR